MIELAILGFLREEPLHGYELKHRLHELTGHVRPVSDGTLYPAIARLERQGFLTRQSQPGAISAPRHVLALTPSGADRLLQLLGEPSDVDISDRSRFFVLLAFLKFLPAGRQRVVLERRLAFLDGGKGFFSIDGTYVQPADEQDRFRRGMLRVAREMSRAERAWLKETLSELTDV